MANSYEIHPRIGVARLGNSPDEFYLSPEEVGGLPIEYDKSGNPILESGSVKFVDHFKDSVGRIKRQAAKFRLFERTGDSTREVKLSDTDVDKIVWTVHIANKKAIWYTFSELQGNLEFGPGNSYKEQHIPLNNPDITDEKKRQGYIIDPGPRSIEQPGKMVKFSRDTVPGNYKHWSFPPIGSGGTQIDSLGELRMDNEGNLIVLGAYGNVTGSGDIASFRGAGGYWDDIADGYVMATIHLKNKKPIDADPAWVIVGSPKYAPELVNITTLYDTMYNVAIRNMAHDKSIYDPKKYKTFCEKFPESYKKKEGLIKMAGYTPLNGYNPDYKVNYTTRIKPIIDRMQSYRWVADIPYLNDFANPGFNLSDSSKQNYKNRLRYFSYFRVPVLPQDYPDYMAYEMSEKSEKNPGFENGPNQLFSSDGIPLMPLNSGDNSVTNTGPIYKFETLSVTQYFFLHQWALGHFDKPDKKDEPKAYSDQLDEAGVGNCVGAPFSPGIETTWIARRAEIYKAPFQFKLAHFEGKHPATHMYDHYHDNGLSTTRDEADGHGCEPGDLTKRMAIPWQADFHECTVQTPNITNPTVNQFADGTGIEVPPAYYVYWWPPQSPMHVVTGSLDPGDQVLDAIVSEIDGQTIIPAGQRVPFQRGIDSTADIIANWSRLGFIVNQSKNEHYPYFVETERGSEGLAQYKVLQQTE